MSLATQPCLLFSFLFFPALLNSHSLSFLIYASHHLSNCLPVCHQPLVSQGMSESNDALRLAFARALGLMLRCVRRSHISADGEEMRPMRGGHSWAPPKSAIKLQGQKITNQNSGRERERETLAIFVFFFQKEGETHCLNTYGYFANSFSAYIACLHTLRARPLFSARSPPLRSAPLNSQPPTLRPPPRRLRTAPAAVRPRPRPPPTRARRPMGLALAARTPNRLRRRHRRRRPLPPRRSVVVARTRCLTSAALCACSRTSFRHEWSEMRAIIATESLRNHLKLQCFFRKKIHSFTIFARKNAEILFSTILYVAPSLRFRPNIRFAFRRRRRPPPHAARLPLPR